ncbi:MAG TPA: Do family serine endopeptidase [Opitutus sp.]|nr:Do family serine endopeptidase [Opitutus sp.]
MKFRLLPCLVALVIVSAPGFVRGAKETRKMPDLKVDSSPVADGKAPQVASYADVIDPARLAVVSVYSKKVVRERVMLNPLLRQFFGDIPEQEREHKEEGLGSGVIISPDGFILTNNHVVEGADELKVSLSDDRELVAKVIGADPKTDIAVIKVEAEHLPTLTLADSDKIRVGDVVFAVGNPLAVGETVTMGIVSAKGRTVGILDDVAGYESFIQTDAAINMGNSGGALLDAKGRLIGINSAILSPSRGNIGIGFAVPINLASAVMRSLIETGSVSRGYLGVQSQTLTPDDAEALGLSRNTKGVTITDVTPNSPADKAGLERGDVILAVNDKAVGELSDLRLAIAQTAPGTKVKVKVARDGKDKVLDVTLGKLDERAPNELLPGVEVTALTGEARRRLNVPSRINGLLITSVDEDSEYADRLAADILILQIDREDVTDLETARRALTPGRHLLIVYYRGAGRAISLEVK